MSDAAYAHLLAQIRQARGTLAEFEQSFVSHRPVDPADRDTSAGKASAFAAAVQVLDDVLAASPAPAAPETGPRAPHVSTDPAFEVSRYLSYNLGRAVECLYHRPMDADPRPAVDAAVVYLATEYVVRGALDVPPLPAVNLLNHFATEEPDLDAEAFYRALAAGESQAAHFALVRMRTAANTQRSA